MGIFTVNHLSLVRHSQVIHGMRYAFSTIENENGKVS